jgi:hypothetical protein
MVCASHPYRVQLDNNRITWTFSNINLPDSNHNKAGSQGKLTYTIRPKDVLMPGDTIFNSSSIYFDFNLPVRTNTTTTVVKDTNVRICPGANTTISPMIFGNSFQWQVDNGSGFVNTIDNANYLGSTNDTLQIILPPTSWYGFKYRCMVTGPAGITYSPEYILRFQTIWNGNSNHDWSLVSNWSCGILPDDNTDVIIPATIANTPEVNINASCRSLYMQSASSILIKPGFKLDIMGK